MWGRHVSAGRRGRFVLAAFVAALSLPALGTATASAAVFCVNFTTPPSDCTNSGYNANQLQNALSDAQGNGVADIVRIAPGTYTGEFIYNNNTVGTGDVSVVGSGQGSTQLTMVNQAAEIDTAFTFSGDSAGTISNLTVEIPGLPPADTTGDKGLFMVANDTASDVTIQGVNASNATGAHVIGSTVTNSTINLPLNNAITNRGVLTEGGMLSQTTILANTGVDHSNSAASTVVNRTAITTDSFGATTQSGVINIRNSTVHLVNTMGGAGLSAANFNDGADTSMGINANHVTIFGGGASTIGVRSRANDPGAGADDTSTVTLLNSIVNGPAVPLHREDGNGDSATLTTDYSNYPLAGVVDTGSGAIAQTNRTEHAPGFVNPAAGNLHLSSTSPLIDIGDPAAPSMATAIDLDGDLRPVDGDGDGTARRDIGADEFIPPPPSQPPGTDPEPQPQAGDANAPSATITGGPKDKTKKKETTYTFNGNDPTRAVASFQCSVDGGAFVNCTSPFSFRVKKGKHTFAVRAVDDSGNVGAPATDDWKVRKRKPKD